MAVTDQNSAAGSSMPMPSPHLERYPILVPPGRRRNTTRTGVRPSLEPRYSPSFGSQDSAKFVNIHNLSARLNERSSSSSSANSRFDALRYEHSPLDQLVKNIRSISASMPRSRAASADSDSPTYSSPSHRSDAVDYFSGIHENQPPTAMTISEVASYKCAVHDLQQVVVPANTDKELPPLPIGETTPPAKTVLHSSTPSIASVKHHVSVYHDESQQTQILQTPAILSRTVRRARVLSDPSSSPTIISTPTTSRQNRHTYPQNMQARDHHAEQRLSHPPSRRLRSMENELNGHFEQLQIEREVWYTRHEHGDLEITPPLQGRYERFF